MKTSAEHLTLRLYIILPRICVTNLSFTSVSETDTSTEIDTGTLVKCSELLVNTCTELLDLVSPTPRGAFSDYRPAVRDGAYTT